MVKQTTFIFSFIFVILIVILSANQSAGKNFGKISLPLGKVEVLSGGTGQIFRSMRGILSAPWRNPAAKSHW